MPRKYARKTAKAAWTAEQLTAALKAIKSGRPTRDVSRAFSIPRTTLQDRLKSDDSSDPSLGRKPVFCKEEENLLAQHVIKLSKFFYGITRAEIQKAAFSYASKKNINHPFSKLSKAAGKDWLEGFLRRNPQISLRKPEATSVNRITAFNREEVNLFYENLGRLMERFKFPQDRIYNADETGLSTVQVPQKILAEKGQKRVGFVTSWEKGKTTTAMCCFSAAGTYVPPMFIFARQRMNLQLKKNGPPNAIYCCSDNGWITEAIFLEWLQHFQTSVKSSKEDPVLLIVDNHVTHCTLAAYNFCRENGISMLTIPPHTSHRIQPLDVTFYFPLKSAFNNECDKYLKSHAFEKITPYEIAELFNKAYSRIATPEKAIKGFEATGIFPLNPDVFTNEDFLPAENLLTFENDDGLNPNNASQNAQEVNENTPPNHEQISHLLEEATPPRGPAVRKQSADTSTQKEISFVEILPLPGTSNSGAAKSKKRKGRKQHSEIFTSTPMKVLLEEKDNKKKIRLEKQEEKKNVEMLKKQVLNEEGLAETITTTNQKIEVDRRQMQKRSCKQETYGNVEESSDSNEDDISEEEEDNKNTEDICIICGEFGKNNEIWLRCIVCGYWAHRECTDKEKKSFVCDFCI